MARPLRVLILDDSEADAALVVLALKQAGLAPQASILTTAAAFEAALVAEHWDLLVSDVRVPGLDTMAFLGRVKRVRPAIPVISVSGTTAEEEVAAIIKAGADAFVAKDRLHRLSSVVTALLRRAEEQAQLELHFRSVWDASPDVLALLDEAGRFTRLNTATEALLGYRPDELLGQHYSVLLPEDERSSSDPLLAVRQTGALFAARPLVRGDGNVCRMDLTATVLPWDGQPILLSLRDVTERVRIEQALTRAAKLEAVGRLAGGIAHDFNNLLGVISGHTELLQGEVEEHTRPAHRLDQILQATERAAALVRQLLTFSRRQATERQVLDLDALVTGALEMLARVIGEDIELVWSPGTTQQVQADPVQVEQVLMNLVVNARDAMPRGGRLSIETRDGLFGSRELPEVETPAAYVVLQVTDTGVGMDASTRARVFEPFFTTKAEGHGTGLGLATVYGIVRQSGGQVTFDSAPEQGTTFRIYLPVATEPALPEHELRAPEATSSGGETILLVEDTPEVRSVTQELLVALGYRVLTAADGLLGLELAECQPNRIDVLLTDVVMPRLSGRELARRLRLRWPDLAVLYMSGYSPAELSESGELGPRSAFLQKPAAQGALARELRGLLARSRTP